MAFLSLSKVLDGAPNVKKDGASYTIGEDSDVSLFVTLGREAMQIVRISKIELGAEAVVVSTHKSERFYFPPDLIVGLQVGGSEKRANKGGGAGFR